MIPIIRSYDKKDAEALKRYLTPHGFETSQVVGSVAEIISEVQKRGDSALMDFTSRFDGVNLREIGLKVSSKEIESSVSKVSETTKKAIKTALRRVAQYHSRMGEKSWAMSEKLGGFLGQIVRPVDSVGIYVPGGAAPLFSTLYMAGVPARVAGVDRIIVCTPPGENGEIDPHLLYTAKLLGIEEIYRIGGAQAVAAMALGTKTIKRVDLIVGPGNAYVAEAKRQVFGRVRIDSIAGPSEVVVIADAEADSETIAYDLLAQSEHAGDEASILITPSMALARAVNKEIEKALTIITRSEIAKRSLSARGAIIVTKTLEEAFALSNEIAPEHLELLIENAQSHLDKVRHAGAVFVGPYSPEAVGDYIAGPNHILPTNGTARFSSPLTTADFLKRSSVIALSPESFEALAEEGIELAEREGLDAHARSIRVRLEKGMKKEKRKNSSTKKRKASSSSKKTEQAAKTKTKRVKK